MRQEFIFTDLQGKDQLIQEIEKLEGKLEQSIGQKVNLIAYSEKKENPQHHEN